MAKNRLFDKTPFDDRHKRDLKATVERLRNLNTPVINRLIENLEGEGGLEFFERLVMAHLKEYPGTKLSPGKLPVEMAEYIAVKCEAIEGAMMKQRMKKQGIILN